MKSNEINECFASRKHKEKTVKEELEFWKNLLPPEWQLYGFDRKKFASVWSPNHDLVELNADFLLAFKEWILSGNPTPIKESSDA